MDDFITLEKEANAEYIVQKSRFIGYACPVDSAEAAAAYVEKIRALHREARHNVFAYTVQSPAYARFSDDGEPQGTAGKPVLEIIKKTGLENCCVVVTRYFGGILLGTGGLVRAYSHTAKLAVEAAGPVRMRLCDTLELRADYSFYSGLLTLIPQSGGKITNSEFAEDVLLTVEIPAVLTPAFEKQLTEQTNGRVSAAKTGETYGKFAL